MVKFMFFIYTACVFNITVSSGTYITYAYILIYLCYHLYHFYCELHYLAGYMVAVKVLLYGIANGLGKELPERKAKAK